MLCFRKKYYNWGQKFSVIGCNDSANVQIFDSAVATFLDIVNNRDQMSRGIAHMAAREDQATLTPVKHLVAVTVATIIERDPSLAGYIGTHIGRPADQIGHLPHTHSNPQPREIAARHRRSGNLAFPAVDALDCLCVLRRFGLRTGCPTLSALGYLCRLTTNKQKSDNDSCNYIRKSIYHHEATSIIELMKNCYCLKEV